MNKESKLILYSGVLTIMILAPLTGAGGDFMTSHDIVTVLKGFGSVLITGVAFAAGLFILGWIVHLPISLWINTDDDGAVTRKIEYLKYIIIWLVGVLVFGHFYTAISAHIPFI